MTEQEKMMDAPEKIWATGWFLDPTCRWWSDVPLGENAAKTEYIRADLCSDPALLAEAVEVLRDAVAAWELHNKTGDMMQGHWAGDARAFIAKWENRHDR